MQELETECGLNDADITGNATLARKFIAKINLAFDDFWNIAIPASGSWDLDDSNQTDYPIITGNLVSGQRDYAVTTDGSSNLVLEIKRVLVANSAGVFSEIQPVDQETSDNLNSDTIAFADGRLGSGKPIRYDKTANGLFLDPIPNYNYTNGIKLYISREPSYFAYSDLAGNPTKKPGVPGNLHRWFVIKPALDHARINNLATYSKLAVEVENMKRQIADYYGSRQRDVRSRMQASVENTK